MEFIVIPVTPFAQNCTLVWCSETKAAAVIDPGGEPDKILVKAKALGLNLEAIWLTHGHLDHVGAAGDLKASLGLPIIGPQKEDDFWLSRLGDQARMFGFPEPTLFKPDRYLDQGDKLPLGKLEFEVLHCPGHTPGHLVFFNRQHQWAQVGDVIFKGSIGRTDFPMGNQQQLLEAIRSRVFPLGDEVRFVPGHGPMSTLGEERRSNPFVADHRFG
ncbi:MBL fold metallo-hydrolase [Gallaecimonas kandeliae]|uniref:MBL fold metallo-hydrolase n=1 Tax=Gallaecimonas kandeliae TaxID=3029055 RepID=UPI0026473D2A|nr:MBL fold metallo-hydrolase [Gallaecimonas kandeliae]WKE67077.1 MBL fold metallo-hydrolase [Gallaecimonas kandeliae]